MSPVAPEVPHEGWKKAAESILQVSISRQESQWELRAASGLAD